MCKIIKIPFPTPGAKLKMTMPTLCVVWMLFFAVTSCGKQVLVTEDKNEELVQQDTNEPDLNEPTNLAGTVWKLAGYVNLLKTGELEELEPKECEDCYKLWFDTDNTLTMMNITKRLKLDLLNLNYHVFIEGVLLCERYDKDGEDYCESDIIRVAIPRTGSYSATCDELKLFQHDPFRVGGEIISSYLLFKRTDDEPPTTLRGTRWKLTGIVETQTGDFRKLEPTNCTDCYSLEFWGDYSLNSRSIWAYQALDLSNLDRALDPTRPWTHEDGPPVYAEEWFIDPYVWKGDGKTYEDSFLFRCGIAYAKSYELNDDELKLFFDYQEKNYYLSFKLVYK